MKARALVFSLLCLLPLFGGVRVAHAQPHNVLLIIVDDLNTYVPPYPGAHPDVVAPHIDRMAAQGTVFGRMHANYALCNPSRTSFLTGYQPWNHHALDNFSSFEDFMPDVVTLPEHFKNNGYRTYGFGKVFHGSATQRPRFDTYEALFSDPDVTSPTHAYEDILNHPINGLPFAWGPYPDTLDEAKLGDTKLAEAAVNVLNTHTGPDPFFLAVGFRKPHLPFNAPQRFFDLFAVDDIDLPLGFQPGDLDDVPPQSQGVTDFHEVLTLNGTDTTRWREAIRAYLACIAWIDELTGRVVEALENSPHADNTLVVFMGDHGYLMGEKERYRKGWLWNYSTQTPFMLYGPGIPVGLNNTPVGLIDLYPTLAELAGIPLPPHGDGRSIAAAVTANAATPPTPVVTMSGLDRDGLGIAFRMSVLNEVYRYTLNPQLSQVELYDQVNDWFEFDNLAAQRPDAAADMRGELAAAMTHRDLCAPAGDLAYGIPTAEVSFWYDTLASGSVVGSSAVPYAVVDRGPGCNNAVQVHLDRQPALDQTPIGLPGLRFDGNDAVSFQDFNMSERGGLTACFTVMPDTTAAAEAEFFQLNTHQLGVGNTILALSPRGLRFDNRLPASMLPTPLPGNRYSLVCLTKPENGRLSELRLSIDGGAQPLPGINTNRIVFIGTHFSLGAGGTGFFSGMIGEAILFRRALSPPEFDALEQALYDKWVLPSTVPVEAASPAGPATFTLSAAYPNPFAEAAQVELVSGKAQVFDVRLYDLLGRLVQTWPALHMRPNQRQQLTLAPAARGPYFLQVRAGNATQTLRVLKSGP